MLNRTYNDMARRLEVANEGRLVNKPLCFTQYSNIGIYHTEHSYLFQKVKGDEITGEQFSWGIRSGGMESHPFVCFTTSAHCNYPDLACTP